MDGTRRVGPGTRRVKHWTRTVGPWTRKCGTWDGVGHRAQKNGHVSRRVGTGRVMTWNWMRGDMVPEGLGLLVRNRCNMGLEGVGPATRRGETWDQKGWDMGSDWKVLRL